MSTEIATTDHDQLRTMLATSGGKLDTAPKSDDKPPEPERPNFSYIGFFGDKTKDETLAAVQAAGVGKDKFYLADNAGVTVVNPFQAYILFTSKFLTQSDRNGDKTDIRHWKKLWPDDELFEQGYRQVMLGVAAVRLKTEQGTVLIPAAFNVRNALMDGFEKVLGVIQKAADDSTWAIRGAAQKAAVEKKLWPTFRVLGTLWGKSGDFYQSFSQVQNTPPEDFDAIQKLCGPEFATKLAPLVASHSKRVNAWTAFANLDDEQKTTAKLPF